ALQRFESELVDRFGELPPEARDLLDSVRVKWIATHIGLEKVVMKQGRFLGYFIADQQSPFYQSPVFTQVLGHAQKHPGQARLKEKQTRSGLRLLLVLENIDSVEKALRALEPLSPTSPAMERP